MFILTEVRFLHILHEVVTFRIRVLLVCYSRKSSVEIL